jgi:hypothetical protein
VPSLRVSGNLVAGDTTINGTLNVSGASTLNSVSCTSFLTSGNITQTAGVTSLQGVTSTSLTVNGNITQSTGTSSLQGVTSTSLTVNGNITQSTGTSSLKAVTATSLTVNGNFTVTGTVSGTFTSVTQVNEAGSGMNINISSTKTYYRVIFLNVSCSIPFQILLAPGISATGCNGGTSGNNGNAKVTWQNINQNVLIYIRNSTAINTPANAEYEGYIDILRVSATSYVVQGESHIRTDFGLGLNNYDNFFSGTVTFASNTTNYDLLLYTQTGGGVSTRTGNIYVISYS